MISQVYTPKHSLDEGKRRDFMTTEEKRLRRKLIELLKDDGKGHHHAAYAKRLAKFDVNIVPIGKSPETAAISFNEGVIYINRGFLRDPDTFWQLNVIIRHELCHNLMMHQFRMIKKLENVIPEEHLTTSMSIHDLLNILEDFEISNKKYSAEDKNTMRNLWLNGRLIKCLVTEDHRPEWLTMSLERMYDAIEAEMDKHGNNGTVDKMPDGDESNLNVASADIHRYKYETTDKLMDVKDLDELEKMILSRARLYDKHAKLPKNFQEIFDAVAEMRDDPNTVYTRADVEKMINKIISSKALQKCDIPSPVDGHILMTVYTPEEKRLAIKCLKVIGGYTIYHDEYRKWYTEIINKLANSTYSEDQMKELADMLK